MGGKHHTEPDVIRHARRETMSGAVHPRRRFAGTSFDKEI